jgi:soluble epoxide hydrolase/lipid-phosphate phosphatase
VGSNKYLPYVTARAIVAAHWLHLEKPAEFNAIMEEWLSDLDVKLLEARIGEMQKEMKLLKKELTSLKRDRKSLQSGEL